MFRNSTQISMLAAALLLIATACGGGELTEEEKLTGSIPTTERTEDGKIISKLDLNQDGEPDVFKFYEEYPDEEDPTITRTRMLERQVDVNYDGEINNRRLYNESGELVNEWLDLNLDGKFDVVHYMGNGAVVRKEVLEPESGEVIANRYYANGEILRVEKDISGNSKIDYWEFYEQGLLDRIGRDVDGDGRADSWQTR